MLGRRSVSLPLWVVLGVVLILTLALAVPDQAVAIAALGGGLLLQALALSMSCGPRRRRRSDPRSDFRPDLRLDRPAGGYPGAVEDGDQYEYKHEYEYEGRPSEADCDGALDEGDDVDGESDGGDDRPAWGGGGGGDARIARQGLSRNDPYRPLVGLTRRKEAIAPYYREDLEDQERRVWWGNSEQ